MPQAEPLHDGARLMHVIAIIFGALLLAFGGGCVLMILGAGLLTDPKSLFADVPLLLMIIVPLGIVPAIGGWFLFQYGMRRSREKQQAKTNGEYS